MNFIAVVYNAFIMKIIWMLLVVLHLYILQVISIPVRTSLCINYCNLLYSGWHMSWANDCYCFPQNDNIETNSISQSTSQPIFHSMKLNNREHNRFFGDSFGHEKGHLNYNNLFRRLIKNYIDVDSTKFKRKIKQTSLGKRNSNDYDNYDNNFNINADNLSVCIDLHILLEKRKKIKNNLQSSDIKPDPEHLEIVEIHRAIAKNCDQTSTIIKNSIAEIKSTVKPKRKINKLDDNEEPLTARTVVSHHIPSNFKNSTQQSINDSNLITTTEYVELIKDNSKELNISEEDNIQKGSTGTPSSPNDESYVTLKTIDTNKTQLTKTEHIKKSANVNISTEATPNKSVVSSNFLTPGKEGSQTVNFNNISISNNLPQRQKYDQSRAYIIKLITQELSNGTVLSFINGTEILSKTSNDDITLQTEISPQNNDAALTPYGLKEQNFLNVQLNSITSRLFIMYEEKRIP